MKKTLLLFFCLVCCRALMAQTVGPLIQTQWNQSAPYNSMCPEVDGVHCLASCGAAAMAQICYYYRWPEHGSGEGHWHLESEVEWSQWHFPDLSGDYYDYDKMLLTYDANSSEEAIQAVALLMRDIAYCGAVFSPSQSYSPGEAVLAENFSYDYGLKHLPVGYFSQDDLVTIIRSELDAGRPVLIGGSNGSMGHSFICDGYNDKGEFHFNYGWGGDSDGWSTIENCLFPISMELTYNIKKDEGGDPGFNLCSDRDFKWLGGNKLYGNYLFSTDFAHELMPEIALAVENTATHEVKYYFHYATDPARSLSPVELVWDFDESLADGDYILYPVAHGTLKGTQWQKGYFRDLCQKEVLLTVKDGVKTFNNATLVDPVRDGAVEADGLCYELDDAAGTAMLTYRNDKYASYAGDVVVPETITVGDKTYTVTAIGEKAFQQCRFLDNVVISKNVTYIGSSAFDEVSAKKISFAEGSQLTTVGGFAFYAGVFDEIILPEGVTDIGKAAFSNSKIGSVTIPSTVTAWGEVCFATNSLSSVHINSTTPPDIEQCFRTNTGDADYADYNDWIAYGIQASVLYVPAGCRSAYEQNAVWGTFGFILEPGDDDSFISSITRDVVKQDGISYQINGSKRIARVCDINDDVKDVAIANTLTLGSKELSVTSIGNKAFCDNYNSIVVPVNVESIEAQAFTMCTVDKMSFAEGSHLTNIAKNGLNGLTTKTLVLPEGLTTLGQMNVTVDDLTIPSTVVNMDENNYFTNIKHCRVSWTTPLEVAGLIGAGVNLADATLHVPEGTKDLYAASDSWKRFGTIIEDGGKSGIQAVTTADTIATPWYTLDGRQLQSQPTRKGIYLHQGRKIVIK